MSGRDDILRRIRLALRREGPPTADEEQSVEAVVAARRAGPARPCRGIVLRAAAGAAPRLRRQWTRWPRPQTFREPWRAVSGRTSFQAKRSAGGNCSISTERVPG